MEKVSCSICIKKPNSTLSMCNRFAFVPLTQEFVDIINRKNLPFQCRLIDKYPPLICFHHRRSLFNGTRYVELSTSRSDLQLEIDRKKEANEFLDNFSELYRASDNDLSTEIKNKIEMTVEKLSTQEFCNKYERYRSIKEWNSSTSTDNTDKQTSFCHLSRNNKKISRIKFESLPAVSLRRYKRFFKLPNRSGASSKLQLLEGLDEHIASITPDYLETAANFLHTIRKKKNRLDFPLELR